MASPRLMSKRVLDLGRNRLLTFSGVNNMSCRFLRLFRLSSSWRKLAAKVDVWKKSLELLHLVLE